MRFLIGLFAVAFLVRLAAVATLRDVNAPPGRQMGADGIEFNRLALNLTAGNGYELSAGSATSFRAPGFPLVLSALYRIVGENYLAAYLLFCAFGAASCLLAYSICLELATPAMARWAGALSAFYLPQIYDCTVFLSENLFVIALGLSVWLQLLYFKRPSAALAAATGVALGASILTRPFALLLAPWFFGLTQFASGSLQTHRFRHAVLLTLSTFLVVAPWAWRNYQVHHAVVLVATNGGSTFYGGNNDIVLDVPQHLGGWVSTVRLPGRELIDATPDEVSHDKLEWRLGIGWVREHVSSLPRLLFYKLARFCLPDVESGNKRYVLLQIVGATPFLLLTYTGIALTLSDRRFWTLPWLTVHGAVLASVATALIFWGSPRFRDANAPLLMVYAAVGVAAIHRRYVHFRLAAVSKRERCAVVSGTSQTAFPSAAQSVTTDCNAI